MILDGVVCPAVYVLCDLCPLVSVKCVPLEQLELFVVSPGLALDKWV